MKLLVKIIANIVTGTFVTVMVMVAIGFSELAETEQPTYDYGYAWWLLIWIVGFALQFNKKTKLIGYLVIWIPTLYFLVDLLRVF